ncbi:MAG: hypothetical protein JXA30_12115 [Deltaproteobacteria bacterium]|nr:hypothetical protein [Deltaproteobacteria bacterium]
MSSLFPKDNAIEPPKAKTPLFSLAAELGNRLGLAIAVTAALSSVVLCNLWSRLYYHNVCDDSLISMQYAKNLALGNGVVFNLSERVEGYTNFLWVVILAPLYRLCLSLGIDFIFVAVQLSILLAAVDLLLVYRVGRLLWQEKPLALIVAVGICLADNSYTVWAIQALESHLVVFWILLALLLFRRGSGFWLGIVLACAVMSRPDALLFVVALLGDDLVALGFARWRRGRAELYTQRARSLGMTLSVFIAFYGSYFFWRYNYYGYLFPNTFYLKMEGLRLEAIRRGIVYLTEFLEYRGWIPVFALLSAFWLGNQLVRVLFLWSTLHLAYVVYVGGDFYPGHRFFIVLIPSIGLLTGQVVDGLAKQVSRWRRRSDHRIRRLLGKTATTTLLALVAVGLFRMTRLGLEKGPYQIEIVQFRDRINEVYSFMRWFGRKHSRPASIVTGDIGSAGFLAGLTVFDYYGVIDPMVAHQAVVSFGKGKAGHEKRADINYLLSRNPKFVRLGYIPRDLSREGYFLDDEGPDGRCGVGIWEKDPLNDSGVWESAGAIPFYHSDVSIWEATDDMRRSWTASGTRPHQQRVWGATGVYLSTFHRRYGDGAVGRVRSTPIPLVGDVMVLRVGGGRDTDRLRVSLMVDDRAIYTTTGRNCEFLGRRKWEIASFRGKSAILEVVDSAQGPWGHIMVDEVRQWSARAREAKK